MAHKGELSTERNFTSMVDFSSLLKKQAGTHKKPPALVAGNYPSIISKFEVDDKNKNKTPYVRLSVKYTGWPDSVAEDQRLQEGPNGMEPIDLSKKQGRRDYYLTEDAIYRLDELLHSLQIEMPEGTTYEAVLPQLVGKHVIAEVTQRMNEQDNSIFNDIKSLTGA